MSPTKNTDASGSGRPPADRPAPRAPADPRFARIATDPRFARFPKAKAKAAVDDRFAAMLHDPAFQTTAAVDKRGRGRAGKAKPAAKAASPPADESGDDSAAERWARARGLAGPDTSEESSSESDTSSSSASSSASESDGGASEPDTTAAALLPAAESIPPAPATTRRLAVVDLDWDRTRAVDVLAALRSFAPAAGRVDRVTIYPSDFGLSRLADEERRGPAPLRAGSHDGNDSSDDDADKTAIALRAYERSRLRYFYAIADTDSSRTAARIVDECDGLEFGRTGAVFDLRFVPDVQDFSHRTPRDTATTVPADYSPPEEVALATAHTRPETGWDADDGGRRRALAAAAGVRPGGKAKANPDALRDDDFKAYLASDDSSDGGSDGERDDAAAAAKYRALLAGGDAVSAPRAGGKAWAAAAATADGDDTAAPSSKSRGNLQVTFAGGLDALSSRLAARADDARRGGGKSVWDEYLAKRAAKRAAKKAGRGGRGGDSTDSGSDGGGVDEDAAPVRPPKGADPFDDPFFADDGADPGAAAAAAVDSEAEDGERGGRAAKEKKKKKSGGAAAVDAATAAQLELVAMDDAALRAGIVPRDDGEDGNTANAAPAGKKSRKQRAKERAAARAAGRAADDSDAEDGRGADLADPRFGRLLTDPAFALDPTDPAFRRAGGAELAGRVREAKATVKPVKGGDRPVAAAAPAAKDDGLQAMVASLKRRAALADGGKRKAAREV